MKIAVCLHLFYPDMFETVVSYLNNLKHHYKLYVTLTNGYHTQQDIQKIKKHRPDTNILTIDNKGVDIGAFLQVLKILDQDTELILKLHTKKGIGLPESPSVFFKKRGMNPTLDWGAKWFNNLMIGVLSDEGKVNRILDKFKTDNNCGMVGYKLYNNSVINKNEILKLCPLFGLNESFLDKHFVGGTIFWTRYNIIRKYFTDEVIKHIMDNTHPGYVIEPSIMHAVERIFGYIITKENQNVITVN